MTAVTLSPYSLSGIKGTVNRFVTGGAYGKSLVQAFSKALICVRQALVQNLMV